MIQVVALSGKKIWGSVAAVVGPMVTAVGTTFCTHIACGADVETGGVVMVDGCLLLMLCWLAATAIEKKVLLMLVGYWFEMMTRI